MGTSVDALEQKCCSFIYILNEQIRRQLWHALLETIVHVRSRVIRKNQHYLTASVSFKWT